MVLGFSPYEPQATLNVSFFFFLNPKTKTKIQEKDQQRLKNLSGDSPASILSGTGMLIVQMA